MPKAKKQPKQPEQPKPEVPATINNIFLVARRWFNKTFGNTYHSVEIYVNGKWVHKIDFAYGYSDQYLYNAGAWLEKNGFIKLEERPDGHPPEALWRWAERTGVQFNRSVTDVTRKKDL